MDDRMLMSRQEAARALNMSLSHFQRHAQSGLPCVRSGQLRFYRRTDLERWVDDEIGADTVRLRAGDHDCNLDSSLRRTPAASLSTRSELGSSRRSWTGFGAKDSPARGSDP